MRLDIRKILVPLDENLSLEPCVSAADRITKAIEAMLKNDLRRIAVTNGAKVIGMIRLEDALKKVGLQEDLKSKGRRSAPIQHLRIIVDERWT
jgi:CBS domain-containing protein